MAFESKFLYRSLLLHMYDSPGIMMAYWTLKAEEHSTAAALERLELLRGEGTGLPSPHRCVITAKRKIHELPLRPIIPLADSSFSDEELIELAKSIAETTDVLLYGEYGSFGRIMRWNIHGAALADIPNDWFVPQADISILDGTFINDDWKRMFLRRNKHRSI